MVGMGAHAVSPQPTSGCHRHRSPPALHLFLRCYRGASLRERDRLPFAFPFPLLTRTPAQGLGLAWHGSLRQPGLQRETTHKLSCFTLSMSVVCLFVCLLFSFRYSSTRRFTGTFVKMRFSFHVHRSPRG